MRLGQAEAAELLAAGQRHEEALLLRVVPKRVDRPADHRVLDADDGRDRAVAGGDLLQREGERHVVEAGAAPALRDHDAQHAEPAQRRQLRARKVVLAVPSAAMGASRSARKRASRRGSSLFFGKHHGVPAWMVGRHRSALRGALIAVVEREGAAIPANTCPTASAGRLPRRYVRRAARAIDALSRSTATAVASPPPMHRPATPRFSPYFRIAASSVTTIRAPEAPIG